MYVCVNEWILRVNENRVNERVVITIEMVERKHHHTNETASICMQRTIRTYTLVYYSYIHICNAYAYSDNEFGRVDNRLYPMTTTTTNYYCRSWRVRPIRRTRAVVYMQCSAERVIPVTHWWRECFSCLFTIWVCVCVCIWLLRGLRNCDRGRESHRRATVGQRDGRVRVYVYKKRRERRRVYANESSLLLLVLPDATSACGLCPMLVALSAEDSEWIVWPIVQFVCV